MAEFTEFLEDLNSWVALPLILRWCERGGWTSGPVRLPHGADRICEAARP